MKIISMGSLLRVFLLEVMAGIVIMLSVTVSARSEDGPDLDSLSLQELMNVKVTSVSKHEEKLWNAPAAIYVIDSEAIRNSGINRVPELLRLAPGMQVSHITSNKWAISSRGFCDYFANKMLVLIDGRSVYNSSFSGVFWDVQDVMIEDIDRIEIIRGPGGTLWGANAVNGVINIITKPSAKTDGMLITERVGKNDLGSTSMRYGGKFGEQGNFRLYTKYSQYGNFNPMPGREASDDWHPFRAGFRIDTLPSDGTLLTVQGDTYSDRQDEILLMPVLTSAAFVTNRTEAKADGGNILARLEGKETLGHKYTLQAYFDRMHRSNVEIDQKIDTIDLEYKHSQQTTERRLLTFGLGYRLIRDSNAGTLQLNVTPASQTRKLASAFVQEEITLVPDRTRLTWGTKFESNTYTGLNIQPSVRMSWTPRENQTFWSSLSRAVRTPSRWERTGQIGAMTMMQGPNIVHAALLGTPGFKNETADVLEVGYRDMLSDKLTVEATAFYNNYRDLRSIERGAFIPKGSYMLMPMYMENMMNGRSYGFEMNSEYRCSDHWRVESTYSRLNLELQRKPGNSGFTNIQVVGFSPINQFSVRSRLDLTRNLKFNTSLFYVDPLPALNVSSYTRCDAQLSWKGADGMEIDLGAQNLFNPSHREFNDSYGFVPTEVPTEYYASLTWRM